jgi:hypothetical protein
MRKPRSLLYLLLALLAVAVGIVTNIATAQIPSWLQPHLWLAWPTLGVLAVLFIVLSVREALGRDLEIPRTSKLQAEEDSRSHLY